MTVLLAIIIASVLCGVLFSAMWASSNSLCVHSDEIGIKVIIVPKETAKELETTVIGVIRQFGHMNIEPEIYILTTALDDKEKLEAEYIAAEYDAEILLENGKGIFQ